MPIRPMLGVNVELNKLKYPVYVSTKLDGVRVVITDNGVFSRSGKLIPNDYTRELFSQYVGLDGELIVEEPTATDVYRKTVSGVMTKEGTPKVRLFAFDSWDSDGGIDARYNSVIKTAGLNNPFVPIVSQVLVESEDKLLKFEEDCLNKGYEGIIIRNPDATYKFGRSTIKEGALLKLKRFIDAEATVVGFAPLLHNENEATINELGYTERSTAKDGKVETDMLGALIVELNGNHFKIGSGFDENTRKDLWANRDKLIGMVAKFKYFSVGVKDKPRFPIFLGFRDRRDM